MKSIPKGRENSHCARKGLNSFNIGLWSLYGLQVASHRRSVLGCDITILCHSWFCFFCFRGPDLVLVNSIQPNGFRWGGHGSLLVIHKLQIFRGLSAQHDTQTAPNAQECSLRLASLWCWNVFCMCCTSGADRLQRRCLIQMATGSLRLTPWKPNKFCRSGTTTQGAREYSWPFCLLYRCSYFQWQWSRARSSLNIA